MIKEMEAAKALNIRKTKAGGLLKDVCAINAIK